MRHTPYITSIESRLGLSKMIEDNLESIVALNASEVPCNSNKLQERIGHSSLEIKVAATVKLTTFNGDTMTVDYITLPVATQLLFTCTKGRVFGSKTIISTSLS